jgi:hypothetical protein
MITLHELAPPTGPLAGGALFLDRELGQFRAFHEIDDLLDLFKVQNGLLG